MGNAIAQNDRRETKEGRRMEDQIKRLLAAMSNILVLSDYSEKDIPDAAELAERLDEIRQDASAAIDEACEL